MRIVLFYHSLRSDWNHGNAHFLRGIASNLVARGHAVDIYEPRDAWSLQNLIEQQGEAAAQDYKTVYPSLTSKRYISGALDLDEALADADLVLVHEWNDHDLVARIGEHHLTRGGYILLFHDTHHRSVTDPASMAAYDLAGYDGALAFGRVIRDIYLREGWARRAWVWHEAADTQVFRPQDGAPCEGDLVWIGNWGDDERTAELHEFLLAPVKALGLRAKAYGVRYPDEGVKALEDAGVEYGGWLPNYRVPDVFSRYRVTVHIPRRPYVRALPGIPTIRPFEALACGIPLICAPWQDVENLFSPQQDYLIARDGTQMRQRLERILSDSAFAQNLAAHGLRTVRRRHTCAVRVDELLSIYGSLANAQTEFHERVVSRV